MIINLQKMQFVEAMKKDAMHPMIRGALSGAALTTTFKGF